MIFKAISHSKTSDAVVEQIERLILEGVLLSGDRLPSERDFAGMLDVSRPVLRMALKELEARNLIQSKHGGGTFVANVVGRVFSDEIFDLIRRHPKAQKDYFEFRRDMETITTANAARRATDADKLILTEIIEKMRLYHEQGDVHKESEADFEFHQAVAEASHNLLMLHTMRSCYKLLAEGLFYSRIHLFEMPGVQDTLLAQHERIYSSIVTGDVNEAKQAARDHIDYVEQTMEQADRAGAWDDVSRMRLSQLADRKKAKASLSSKGGSKKPASATKKRVVIRGKPE